MNDDAAGDELRVVRVEYCFKGILFDMDGTAATTGPATTGVVLVSAAATTSARMISESRFVNGYRDAHR